MKVFKLHGVAKPIQYLGAAEFGVTFGLQRVIRWPLPISEIGYKPVYLRIKVNIENQIYQVALGSYRDATKAFLKKTSRSPVCFVDGFGVGVKQVGKTLQRFKCF